MTDCDSESQSSQLSTSTKKQKETSFLTIESVESFKNAAYQIFLSFHVVCIGTVRPISMRRISIIFSICIL